jgi:hypothetical protein
MLAGEAVTDLQVLVEDNAFVGGGQEFGGVTDRGSIPVSRGTLA